MGRDYWRLWTSSTISNLGGGISGTAFALLAAALTRDPSLVAGLTVAFTLPWLLFGLPAGALVDRLDRRRVMVAVNASRAVVLALFAAAVAADAAGVPLLYATAFALGSAETLYDNAAQSILPALVPRARLESANGWLLAAERVTNEFAGPPLGGLLFALAAWTAIAVDAAGFAASALLLAAIHGSFRVPREDQAQATTLLAEVAEGLRWLWANRPLHALAVSVAVLGLVDSAWVSILVLYALEILEFGAAGFGVLGAAGGVGAVAGSAVAPALSRVLGRGGALILALVVAGMSQLGLGLISIAAVAGPLLAVSGFAFGVWNVAAVSLRQAVAPDRLLGRVHCS